MKQSVLLAVLTLVTFSVPTTSAPVQMQESQGPESKAVAAIRAVLEAQRVAWNKGEIDGYMDGYERSDATVFVSGDNVSRGWQTVYDRYKTNYNSREKMGTLTFSDLEVTLLGDDAAVVLGRWHLQRAADEPHGRFTLVLRRTRHGWRIIHDHTSTA